MSPQPHSHPPTFAGLPVGLEHEAHGAAAVDAGGRVVALAVTAPVVHSTRLCTARGQKGWGEGPLCTRLGESPHPDVPHATAVGTKLPAEPMGSCLGSHTRAARPQRREMMNTWGWCAPWTGRASWGPPWAAPERRSSISQIQIQHLCKSSRTQVLPGCSSQGCGCTAPDTRWGGRGVLSPSLSPSYRATRRRVTLFWQPLTVTHCSATEMCLRLIWETHHIIKTHTQRQAASVERKNPTEKKKRANYFSIIKVSCCW